MPGWKINVTFDPVLAARNADPSDESRFTAALGVRISIVGTDDRYVNVWVADDGRVGQSVEADFRIIGDDMFDGVNALCEGNDYQVVDDLFAAVVIEIAELGQRQLASRSVQEPDAETVFELTDTRAHVSLRDTQGLGGRRPRSCRSPRP